jgi:hypothetical protein
MRLLNETWDEQYQKPKVDSHSGGSSECGEKLLAFDRRFWRYDPTTREEVLIATLDFRRELIGGQWGVATISASGENSEQFKAKLIAKLAAIGVEAE